jgi:hypothetical protein
MNKEMKVLDESIKFALRPLLASIVCKSTSYFDEETWAFSKAVDPLKIHQVVDLSLLSAVPWLSLDYSGATWKYWAMLRRKYNAWIVPVSDRLLIGEWVKIVIDTTQNQTVQEERKPRPLITAPEATESIWHTPLRSQLVSSPFPLSLPGAQQSTLLKMLWPWKPWESFFLNPWKPNPQYVIWNDNFTNIDGSLWNWVNADSWKRQKIFRGDMISETRSSPLSIPQSEYENLSDEVRADVCYNFFVWQGLPPHVASAAIGNMRIESHDYLWDGTRLSSTVQQKKGDRAFWLCQWAHIRLEDFHNFASEMNLDPNHYFTQLSFVLKEFNSWWLEWRAYDHLIGSTSVSEATEIFVDKYERAWVPHLDKRRKAANEIYQRNVV